MKGDLISRSALIQALRGNVLVDVTPHLEEAIEGQPAAYDVEDTERKLMAAGDIRFKSYTKMLIPVEDAVKIVRAGLKEAEG